MVPISCLLLAIYPILLLWPNNWEEVFFPELVTVFFGTIALTTVCYWCVYWLVRDTTKATALIVLFLAMFVSFDFPLLLQVFVRLRFVLPVWGVIFVLLSWVILKSQRDLRALVGGITVVMLALNLAVVPSLVSNMYTSHALAAQAAQRSSRMKITSPYAPGTSAVGYMPDIYYIILDAYTRADTLREVYDFDNTPFLSYLQKQGFFVADKSLSNYTMTRLSLPSSISTDYLTVYDNQHYSPYEYFCVSPVVDFLKRQGYAVSHISSGIGFTLGNKQADRVYGAPCFGRFSLNVVDRTVFGRLIPFRYKQRVLFAPFVKRQFSTLQQASHVHGPQFVFCHVLCPHEPFIFNKNGGPAEYYPSCSPYYSFDAVKKPYAEQAEFVAKMVQKTVDYILKHSEKKPIIIIQGDHGTFFTNHEYYATGQGDPGAVIKERMSILNAYYLPGGGGEKLYDTITPVNSFRVILDYYFNTNLGLLLDKCLWSTANNSFIFTHYTPEELNALRFKGTVEK